MQVADVAREFGLRFVWKMGIRYRRPYPPAYRPKREEDRRPPVLFMPLGGRACGIVRIAISDTCVEPCLDLLEQPHDSILAEPNPLGKLPCRFEPRDVLRRIRNAADRSQLLFRYDLLGKHRTLPWKGASTLRLRRTGERRHGITACEPFRPAEEGEHKGPNLTHYETHHGRAPIHCY